MFGWGMCLLFIAIAAVSRSRQCKSVSHKLYSLLSGKTYSVRALLYTVIAVTVKISILETTSVFGGGVTTTVTPFTLS